MSKHTLKVSDLGDDGGLVDVSAVAPAVHAALLLQLCEVDVSAWNESLSRQISDHVQSVSAAAALLLFPIHHLTVTITQNALVTFWLQFNKWKLDSGNMQVRACNDLVSCILHNVVLCLDEESKTVGFSAIKKKTWNVLFFLYITMYHYVSFSIITV